MTLSICFCSALIMFHLRVLSAWTAPPPYIMNKEGTYPIETYIIWTIGEGKTYPHLLVDKTDKIKIGDREYTFSNEVKIEFQFPGAKFQLQPKDLLYDYYENVNVETRRAQEVYDRL
eukprot:275900_1